MAKKTCIEVAVNGASTRRLQPRIPVLAKEIINEGVACIKAGAAVIHAHTLEPDSGKQNGNVDNCVAFISGIREPVSYTHLDVYKRQHNRRKPDGICARPQVPQPSPGRGWY